MDIKKYFQFTGTINGLNYFLRNLLSYFLAFFAGYGIGYGMGMGDNGLTTLSLILLVPVLWFSFTTIWKRMNALFPKNATLFTVGLIFFQTILQFLPQDNPLQAMLTLALFVIGLILIFKNSEIKEHNG